MRDGLKGLPGVTIVADITPNQVNKEAEFATMNTVLQAHPNIDVVLGADTVVWYTTVPLDIFLVTNSGGLWQAAR